MSDGLVGAMRALTPAARLDLLAELDCRIGALQAEQMALLAVIDADPVTVSVDGATDKRWAVEDVGCVLRLSPGVARSRLAEASAAARLPGVLGLLAGGQVSSGHVRVLTDATLGLDDTTAREITARVIGRAGGQSVGAFRQAVRRAVLTVTAPTIEDRREANVADRRVCLRPAGEGTSELWALLPEEGAAAVMGAITALTARRVSGDERTVDQRRADALVQLGVDALAGQLSTVLPVQQRLRPAIGVTVALSTLLGLDEQPGELTAPGTPTTPIPATLARRLAADPSGTWRRLVTDPLGRLVDYGRSTYRPPAALADHVIARDRTCRFPHCTRAASTSELDHTRPWADGGCTNASNLVALCPRHHHLRHETRWSYQHTTNGTTQWRSPTGTTHTTPAATYPIDHTATDHTATDRTADPPPF